MKTQYCIYQTGKANIETVCFAEDGEVLKSSYSGDLFEDILKELNAKREDGSPEYQILKLDDVMPLIEAAQEAKYCSDWKEISEDEWYENLEVLPPEKWETVQGVNIFRMCEYLTGNITAHFAKLNGKFFTRNCSTRETYEELAEQVSAKWFVPSVLTMLRRMVDETSGGGVPCLLTLEQARAAILNAEKEAK